MLAADRRRHLRKRLAEAYLAGSGYASGVVERQATDLFRARVANADAFVHVQDLPGQDVLEAGAFFEHEGGFAAAARSLGAAPSLYHLDTTANDKPVARSLREEIARAVRGRAANPRWIAGQMRHGYRGASEIAETVDNLYAFAVTGGVVTPQLFDLVFDATLGERRCRRLSRTSEPRGGACDRRAIRPRAAARPLDMPPQFDRDAPREPVGEDRMSAGLAPRKDLRPDALRRGWCPGALRPMSSGDGLIARLRIVGGAVTPRRLAPSPKPPRSSATAISTSPARGNLQISGGRREHPRAVAIHAGRARLDRRRARGGSGAQRHRRALWRGSIPALLDIRPSVTALDERLRSDRALWRLPAKFGFAIDDGGCSSVAREAGGNQVFRRRTGRPRPVFDPPRRSAGGIVRGR